VLTPAKAKELVAKDPKSATVLHPYLVGRELNRKGEPSRFIIDIDAPDVMVAAAVAPQAYEHVKRYVLPDREETVRKEAERNRKLLEADADARLNWERRDFMPKWWQLWRRREDMLDAVSGLSRYIAISRVAVRTRPSIYAFVSPKIWPGDALTIFAFQDDYSFGILNSSHHRAYFEERCSKMRVDLRYTSRTAWDTFPWPQAPTDETAGAVASAAEALLNFRDERLDDGISLLAQYDSMRDPGRNPLRKLQEDLDEAVSAAYGFSRDDDVLAQLLALNLSIAEQERDGSAPPRPPGNEGLAGTVRTSSFIKPTVNL
jgi:hypothetical protein